MSQQVIRNMLTMMAGPDVIGRSGAQFLLDHGKEWTPQHLPTCFMRGERKQCFANSQKLLSRSNLDLIYVEGFAISGDVGISIPVHHGWLVDRQGRVIDVTWGRPDISLYFGVALKTNFLLDRVVETMMWCSAFDNPYTRRDQDVLQGLYPWPR